MLTHALPPSQPFTLGGAKSIWPICRMAFCASGAAGGSGGEEPGRLDEKLDGTLDLAPHGRRGIKFLRTKDLAHDRTHLEVVFANSQPRRRFALRAIREEAPELPGEKLRARRLFHQNIDNVVTAPGTCFSHERFGAGIGLARSKPKLLICEIEAVTGKFGPIRECPCPE